MNFKISFVVFALVAVAVASCEAQSNVTVPVPIYATLLDAEFASCALRDQIGWLNQILAVEYVAQAYFTQLNNNMGNVNTSWLTASQFGGNLDEIKSNVTLIVNQLNEVVSWLNSTVNSYCNQLPNNSDDEFECYSFVRCNYTFGNLTGWPNTTTPAPAPTAAPTAAPTNSTSNSTSNSTAPSNSTLPPNNSTSRTSNITTYVVRAMRQAIDFSSREAQYIISMVPVISNSTLQQQLSLFAVLHSQHAAYMRSASTHGTEFDSPVLLSSSNALQRSTLRSELLPYIADQDCCDGFRGLRRQ